MACVYVVPNTVGRARPDLTLQEWEDNRVVYMGKHGALLFIHVRCGKVAKATYAIQTDIQQCTYKIVIRSVRIFPYFHKGKCGRLGMYVGGRGRRVTITTPVTKHYVCQ